VAAPLFLSACLKVVAAFADIVVRPFQIFNGWISDGMAQSDFSSEKRLATLQAKLAIWKSALESL
jgi:hypothetical protein